MLACSAFIAYAKSSLSHDRALMISRDKIYVDESNDYPLFSPQM